MTRPWVCRGGLNLPPSWREDKYMLAHSSAAVSVHETPRQKKTTWCQSTHLRRFYLLSQWEAREEGVLTKKNRSFSYPVFTTTKKKGLWKLPVFFFFHSRPSNLQTHIFLVIICPSIHPSIRLRRQTGKQRRITQTVFCIHTSVGLQAVSQFNWQLYT